MTLVNLPLLLLLYVFAVSSGYSLLGGGLWIAGRQRASSGLAGFGWSLVVASGWQFLAYCGAVTAWVILYDVARAAGEAISLALLVTAPVAVAVPPVVGVVLYLRD